ncbi:hypothetical protein Pla123a_14310 [Posidoniimonas polymericola]|uniref:Ice-binding protein C-terminal domain-containing protein n=1 Tax=Posidoniimonas polymericola TaxID=2528002 RepID=A0A5C5YRV2_9BACT|nr:PEP-CTERM sorting domain-containing protein [Posidoniimonas polymericola]TWT77635.1 hypothetical protein Pla123a_14310 [Posidoniimonas polymericola]
MYRTLVAALLLFTAPVSSAAGIFSNGESNVVDASNSPIDGAVIRDSPEGDPTEVIVLEGGVISNAISIVDSSVLHLRGGELSTYVQGGGASRIFIESGVVGTQVAVYGAAVATISGGSMNELIAAPGGVIALSGGVVNERMRAGGGGTINVIGRGFNYPAGPLPVTSGTLTGFLADGSFLSTPFISDFRGVGMINLVVVPEPTSMLLLALGGLWLTPRSRRPSRGGALDEACRSSSLYNAVVGRLC